MGKRLRKVVPLAAALLVITAAALHLFLGRSEPEPDVVAPATAQETPGNVAAPEVERSDTPARSAVETECQVLGGRVVSAMDGTAIGAGEVLLLRDPPVFIRLPVMADLGFSGTGRGDQEPLARAPISGDGTFELSAADLSGYLSVAAPFVAAQDVVRVDAAVDAGRITIRVVPAGVVRGQVVDPEGAPLPRVRSLLSPAVNPMAMLREGVRHRGSAVSADAGGRFEFRGVPAGLQFLCAAEPDGFLPCAESVVVAAGETVEVSLVAKRAESLSGRVTSESGAPVAEARVVVQRSRLDFSFATGRSYELDERTERTDQKGHFRFAGLRPGEYTLTARADGFAPQRLRAVEVPPGGVDLDQPIVLHGGLVIRGTVVDDRGLPVPEARVGFIPPSSFMGYSINERVGPDGAEDFGGSRGRCDADGHFTSPVLEPGSYDVTAGAPGLTNGFLAGVETGTDGHVVALTRHGSVHGIVLSRADGEPVRRFIAAACRKVSLLELGGITPPPVRHVTTADGTFAIDSLPSGAWQIQVAAADHASETTPEFEVRPGEAVRGVIIILPPAAAIRGLVLDSEWGTPVAGARVSTRSGISLMSASPLAYLADTLSDAAGRFEIGGLSPGRHALAVTADGYAPGSSRESLVGEGQVIEDLVIQLDPGATITGRVTLADGSPHQGAVVQAIVPGSLMPAMTSTDADGRYEITGLAAGSYTVNKIGGSLELGAENMISSIADGLATRTVAVKRGEVVVVDFTAGGSGTVLVRGRVTAGGDPLKGAILSFTPEDLGDVELPNGFRLASVDEHGAYRLENMIPGDWTVTVQGGASLAELTRQSFDVTIPDVPEYVKDLELDVTGVAGVVLARLFREPLGNIRVSVEALDAAVTIDAISRAADSRRVIDLFTNQEGRFRSTGLPPGRYRVYAGGPGMFGIGAGGFCRSDPVEVEVKRGELTRDVEILLDPGGVVHGRITGKGDTAIQGATLFFVGSDDHVDAHFGEIVSDDAGAYRADGLRAGTYSIVVKATGYAPGVAHGVLVRAAEETERSIALRAGARLALLVSDTGGAPLRNVSVHLFDAGGADLTRFVTIGEVMTEVLGGRTAGRYDLGALEPGLYTARLGHDGRTLSIEVQHGGADQTVPVILE